MYLLHWIIGFNFIKNVAQFRYPKLVFISFVSSSNVDAVLNWNLFAPTIETADTLELTKKIILYEVISKYVKSSKSTKWSQELTRFRMPYRRGCQQNRYLQFNVV